MAVHLFLCYRRRGASVDDAQVKMMRLLREMHHYRVAVSVLSRRTIRGAGWYSIIQGVGIIVGGPFRWSSPTYAALREVPGGPPSWGVAAIVIGVAVLCGSYRRNWWVKSTGMFLLSMWSFCFALGALVAGIQFPGAGTTAPPVYFLVAYWTAALIWVDEGKLDAPSTHRRRRRLGRAPRRPTAGP